MAAFSTARPFSRLIRFDKRGTGLSDRVAGVPDLETRMDDVRAVMDAAGSAGGVLSAGGRPDGDAVRRDVPRADAGARPVRHHVVERQGLRTRLPVGA